MGRFSGVLLATDYDDTLYDSHATISWENRAAIERFVAEGGLFTISTGRSYINFAIQMEKEHLPVNAPVILSNGPGPRPVGADPPARGRPPRRRGLRGLPGARGRGLPRRRGLYVPVQLRHAAAPDPL